LTPRARIYQPARPATQSGQGRSREWVLEFAPAAPREVDPLMGWTGSADTQGQVRLRFPSREAAEAYARDKGLAYDVVAPKPRQPNIRPAGYAENFATGRRGAWTH
jgi:NADH dehydrogenase